MVRNISRYVLTMHINEACCLEIFSHANVIKNIISEFNFSSPRSKFNIKYCQYFVSVVVVVHSSIFFVLRKHSSKLHKSYEIHDTWRMPLVEQTLFTLPEYLSLSPILNGVRVTRSLVLCVCFIDRYFFWPVCCLSFALRIVITPLVSSNSSYLNGFQYYLWF